MPAIDSSLLCDDNYRILGYEHLNVANHIRSESIDRQNNRNAD